MVTLEEIKAKRKLKVLLKGYTSTGKCAKEGTLVLTDKGLVKIEDMVHCCTDFRNKDRNRVINKSQRDLLESFGEYIIDNDSDVDTEEFIYSDNVKNIRNVISLSSKLDYKSYNISAKYDMKNTDTITLKTEKIRLEICGTPEHKIVIINKDGNLVFKKLQDIRKGDSICITCNTNIYNDRLLLNFRHRRIQDNVWNIKTLSNIGCMNTDIARLLGYIISEGSAHFDDDDIDFFEITTYDKEMQDNIIYVCNNLEINHIYTYDKDHETGLEKNDGNPTGIRIRSVNFADFAYYLGYRHLSQNKEVPWSILQADKESQTSFLRALFDGDGYVGLSKDEERTIIEYGSSSPELIRQLQLMLLNMGIIGRYGEHKGTTLEYRGEIREYEKSYRLTLYGENILKFYELIGFGLTRKKEILEKCVDYLRQTKRWTNITYPNIDKKLKVLHERLKLIGKSGGIIRTWEEDLVIGEKTTKITRRMSISTKEYLRCHDWLSITCYINRETASSFRSPSRDTLKDILDMLNPVKDMKEWGYLDKLSDRFIFDEVEEINIGREHVYDLTIDSVSSYIGNGMINHNTHCCVKVADTALRAGKRVLYLDHERGSVEEIIRYLESDSIKEGKEGNVNIKNLFHEDYFAYMDLNEKIKRYLLTGIDLIIIDPMPLLSICRISATDQIKKQGFYYQGDMKVNLVNMTDPEKYLGVKNVDNKITYSLRGWQYSLSNDWETTFKDTLVSITPDIVCTLMLPDEKNSLDGCFDYILELSKIEDPMQTQRMDTKGNLVIENSMSYVYKGIPKKVRGTETKKFSMLTDPWKYIVELFQLKYGSNTGNVTGNIDKENKK